MKGQMNFGKGDYHQRSFGWQRHRPPTHPVHIPTRQWPHTDSGDNALNVKMSLDTPPDWGPHLAYQLPFFQYDKLVREWVRACKIDEEKQGDIMYHHLQGVAKSKIENWLEHPDKKKRRTERMKKGNMKYRAKRYKEKIEEQEERERIREVASLSVVRNLSLIHI